MAKSHTAITDEEPVKRPAFADVSLFFDPERGDLVTTPTTARCGCETVRSICEFLW